MPPFLPILQRNVIDLDQHRSGSDAFLTARSGRLIATTSDVATDDVAVRDNHRDY
jgi:hypothetical protein